jgi:hypothetical protein
VEALVDLGEHVYDLVGLLTNAKVHSCLAQFSVVEAFKVGNGKFEDLLGVGRCNVFDRHTTGGAVNECGAAGFSVECQTQVHLLRDVDFLDEVDSIARQTIDATLMRDKSLSEHLSGHGFGLGSVFDEVDTTLETRFLKVAKATTTA